MTTTNDIYARSAPGPNDVFTSSESAFSDANVMSHAFWLNDLLFHIPPQNIIAQSEDTIYQFQALRTANSSKIHTGNGNKVFRILVDVPSKSAIQNVDYRLTESDVISRGDNTGRRGGLLDLIIQFKNIPFARIENAFLRSEMRIPAERNMVFCLHHMNYNTIPGEPGTVRVSLLVTVFNYSPFSDKWAFREDWRTSDAYGNLRFDDVNTIDLPGRERYKLVTSQVAADLRTSQPGYEDPSLAMSVQGGTVYDRVDPNLINPGVREFLDTGKFGDQVINTEVNIDFAESDNSLWGSERQYMATTTEVLSPSLSSVFKDYIDWLHYQWTKIEDIDSPAGFDCTRLSPYNSNTHNVGDEIVLRWKEYETFEMSPDLVDKMRTYVRERVLDIATGLGENRSAAPQGGVVNSPSGPQQLLTSRVNNVQYLDGGNQTPESWASRWITGGTGRFMDERVNNNGVDDPHTQRDESVRYHMGVDLRFAPRAPVYSIWDGVVTRIVDYVYQRRSPLHRLDYGYQLSIRSADDPSLVVTYMHIKDIPANLSVGDSVLRGQQVGVNYYAEPGRQPYPGKTDAQNEALIAADRFPGGDLAHIHLELEVNRINADPLDIDIRGIIDPSHVPGALQPPTASPTASAPSTPGGIYESAESDIPEFRQYVQQIEDDGWTFYSEDLTRYDTFYRMHEIRVSTNSSTMGPGSPIVCNHVGINMRNMFKQIPLSGAPYPTSQYLGKHDDGVILSFEAAGLNHVKRFSTMQDMLRRQAIKFKSIPDSWVLRVENNLINASGNRHFVINSTDSATVPESPGLYNMEMRLLANINKPQESRLSYVGSVSPQEVKLAFIKRLVGDGDDERSFFEVVTDAGRKIVRVRQSEVDRIFQATPNDPQKNFFVAYLSIIAANLNTVNSLFVDWQDAGYSLAPSNFNIPTHEDGTGVQDAFGFGGEHGNTSLIFRSSKLDGESYRSALAPGREAGTVRFHNMPYNYNSESSDCPNRARRSLQNEDVVTWYGRIEEDPLVLISDGDLDDGLLSVASLETTRNADRAWTTLVDPSVSIGVGGTLDNSSSLYVKPIPGSSGEFFPPYVQLHKAAFAWARTINMWGAARLGRAAYEAVSSNEKLQDFLRRAYDVENPVAGAGSSAVDIGSFTFGFKRARLRSQLNATFPASGYFWADMPEFVEGEGRNPAGFMWTPQVGPQGIDARGPVRDASFDQTTVEPVFNQSVYQDFFALTNEQEFKFNLNTFEEYLWNQQARPMIANAIDMGQIQKWIELRDEQGNLVFEEAFVKSNEDRVNSIGPAYRDVMLPLHPYWASNTGVEESTIWTDPDFYLYSAGIDGNAESPSPAGQGLDEDAATAYNRMTQLEVELSIESLQRVRPGLESTPRFESPARGSNLYEGSDAGFELEFGFNSAWPPGHDEETDTRGDGGVAATTMQNEGDGDENHGSNLRNAEIYTDRDPEESPWREGVDKNDQPYALEDNLSYGMLDVLQNSPTPKSNDHIDWRRVAPMFGLNPNFTDLPPGFDRGYLNDRRDQENKNPVEVISLLQGSRDFVPYNFMVEGNSGEDPRDSFIPGNWGYSDIGHWSNTRFALYDKVRDALKSIGTKKWVCRRAFPTFKVFLIEEDSIEYEWVVYDDLYTYDQIESINISDSRKRPASLATITFLNIGGVLDGHNHWRKAQEVAPGEELTETEQRDLARRQASESGEAGTRYEQNVNGFVLDVGTKIKIKMGFSNHSDRLREMFIGEVTEVRFLEEGNKVAVVCQSYGTELVAKAKGTSKKEIRKTYVNTFDLLAHMMFEPEVVHFGKKQRDTVSLGVENQSIETNQLIHKNTFGRTPFRNAVSAIGKGIMDISTLGASYLIRRESSRITDYIDKSMAQVKIKPLEGPQDDNIFVPHFSRTQRMRWYNFRRWKIERLEVIKEEEVNITNYAPGAPPVPVPTPATGAGSTYVDLALSLREDAERQAPTYRYFERLRKTELEYNVFYSTIWGLFGEMTLRHPGFVKHARPYGNSTRMTMFFGLPDQRYWAKEPSLGEVVYGNNLLESMFRIFRPDTSVTGASRRRTRQGREDRAVVQASDLSKFMQLTNRRFRPFRDWHHVNSSTDIISNNMIANKYGFYTGVHVQYVGKRAERRLKKALERLEEDSGPESTVNPNGFVKFRDKNTEEMLAHRDLSTDNIRSKFHEFPNCRGRPMARRYGRALLANYAKEMYKGSLSILGNPDIKPYDVVIINDTYNDISGPIEVEEVIHMFSPATGYITEIIPDTLVIQEDIAPMVILNGVRPAVMMKTEKYLEQALFTRSNDLPSDSALNIIADAYRYDVAQERFDVANAVEFFDDVQDRLAVGTVLSGGAGAIAAGLGLISAPLAVGAAGVAGVGASAAMFSLGSFYLNNYVAKRRAFIMVPLIRSGKPWVAGFELSVSNSYYRGMFDVMRKWWDGGAEGYNLMVNDRLVNNQRIRDMYGDDLTMLANLNLNWNEIGPSFRRGLVNRADRFLNGN